MPSLRIVYILNLSRDGELECTAHSTSLMKWEAFNPSPIRFEQLFGNKYSEALDPADRKLVLRLRTNTRTREPDIAVLSGSEGHDLFHALINTNRAFWAKGNHLRLNWDDTPMPVQLDWRITGIHFQPILKPAQSEAIVLPCSPPLQILPNQNQCGPVSGSSSNALLAEWAAAREMDTDRARTFCLRLLNHHPGQNFPIPEAIKVEQSKSSKITPELTLSRRAIHSNGQLTASLNKIVLVELNFRYGIRLIEADSELDFVSFTQDETVIRMPRDRELEKNCHQQLLQLGFEPAPADSNDGLLCLDVGGYFLSEQAPTSWEELLNQVFPSFESDGWKIRYTPGFRLSSIPETETFSEAKQHKSWFEYNAGVSYKGIRFSAIDLIRDFIRTCQSNHLPEMLKELSRRNLALPLEDGEFLIFPGKLLQNILREVFELIGQRSQNGSVQLSRWRAAELSSKGLLDLPETDIQNLPDMEVLTRYMNGQFELSPMSPPPQLRAELRDYQKIGLAWLQFLRESGTHGVLADDMGLGKTLQTIACLCTEQAAKRLNGPSLVVAPTSVLDNWKAEIERFAPDLHCRVYHGSERDQLLNNSASDTIFITTYAILRNDISALKEIDWHYLIVDEAQFIKNASSLSARSLCQLSARHKLCLTGTPIENRLSELWSLFHFLMPDFLGNHRTFQQTYAREIESGSTDGRTLSKQLRKRISPFLLRRKKELVASELPRKTEIIRPIELSTEQSERYEAVRAVMNHKIAEELENRGLAASRIVVLDALLKLRQICCDPRLYSKGSTENAKLPSAKLEAAIELIESLLENGHRILLFSQFTSMLELIAEELEKRNIDFRTLTGATTHRGDLVESFQNGDFPLFLISLKAGGTGLNLTAADTIIHYDPWWNPAAEAQATDRSHRIGQDKPVFVYKLIAENTVEAKILELQQKKGQLAAGLLDNIDDDQMRTFTESEILALFQPE